jgi:hypothetical protein
MGKRESPIKVCLTNQGSDTETPWADDLGDAPAPNPRGSRLVRLVNVPFLHAKPTWGDVIVVEPDDVSFPTWDRRGVPFANVDTRIHEDGGRWAMIVDYAPHPDSPDAAYATLARACAELEIVCEGAWGPRDGEPGRAYLAVKNELSDKQVMSRLRASDLPCELIQIHPEPPKRAPAKKKKPAAKPKAKAAAAKPAAKAAAKRASKPAPKKKPPAKKR